MSVRTAVVTDSTSTLPAGVAQVLGIEVVPLNLHVAGRVYLDDGVQMTPERFYRILPETKELPTTSQPSPELFLDAYRRAASRAREGILCLTLSAALSGTYKSAEIAADLFRQESALPVRVVDSRTVAGAEGLLALAAARWGREAGPDQVEAAVRSQLGRSQTLFLLDTLEYLARGGRIGRAAAWLGTLLQMKPILQVHQNTDGVVSPLERVRTRTRGMSRLEEIAAGARAAHRGPLHIAVQHAGDPAASQVLQAKVAAIGAEELWSSFFTPVMGAHTGPGLVGLAFWQEHPEETGLPPALPLPEEIGEADAPAAEESGGTSG